MPRILSAKKKKVSSRRKTGYKTGTFKSKKMGEDYTYRSSYEFAHFTKLENDPNVKTYNVEPFGITYEDASGTKHVYIPDVFVQYQNGDVEIQEIKPREMLNNPTVQRKAKAAVAFVKKMAKTYNMKVANVHYRFVTEDEIFANEAEYLKLVAKL